MAAKFYTTDELQIVRDRAVEIAAEGVENFCSDIGSHFGRALFFAAHCDNIAECDLSLIAANALD